MSFIFLVYELTMTQLAKHQTNEDKNALTYNVIQK